MSTYEIVVERPAAPKYEGTLTYKGTIVVKATCYWNPDRRIEEYDNAGCCATKMAKANREAIWLPNAVNVEGKTRQDIFIHKGKNLTNLDSLKLWSQGCIVLDEAEVMKIWNDIPHKEQPVVHVKVTDV